MGSTGTCQSWHYAGYPEPGLGQPALDVGSKIGMTVAEHVTDVLLHAEHLEEVDEEVDHQRAIGEVRTYACRRAAVHFDPEMLAGGFRQQLHQVPIRLDLRVPPSAREQARLAVAGIAIELQARRQRNDPQLPGRAIRPFEPEQSPGAQCERVETLVDRPGDQRLENDWLAR